MNRHMSFAAATGLAALLLVFVRRFPARRDPHGRNHRHGYRSQWAVVSVALISLTYRSTNKQRSVLTNTLSRMSQLPY